MSRWEPHLDLIRLLEALANEIVATTDDEVHRVCDEGWCTAATAKEVRDLIGAVCGDPGDPDIDPGAAPTGERIELESSAHHGIVAEPGRTCHRQH